MEKRTLGKLIKISLMATAFALGRAQALEISKTAVAISNGLGNVKTSVPGGKGPVFIFEESHNSRLAQVQIAHMLVRLRNEYGMASIGLEGSLPSQGPLQAEWSKDMDEGKRADIAGNLLEDGEINSAEFIKLAFPEVQILGIDDEEKYRFELDDMASAAGTVYLTKLAEGRLGQSQIIEINRLAGEGKIEKAIDIMMSADPFTKRTFAKLRSSKVISCEEMVSLLEGIEKETRKRSVVVGAELEGQMADLEKFFAYCGARSATMVEKTTKMSEAAAGKPVAMIIGAAHTEKVCNLFQSKGISYSVVSPKAMGEGDKKWDLETQAYMRKGKSKSVDSIGQLGAALDGRRKPPPVLNQAWFKSKANLYYATTLIAEYVKKQKPIRDMIGLDNLEGVKIDRNKIEVNGGEAVFPVQVQDQKGNWVDMWIRTVYDPRATLKNEEGPLSRQIESLLRDTRSHLQRVAGDASAAGGDGGGIPPSKPMVATSEGSDGSGSHGEGGAGEKPNGTRKIAIKEVVRLAPGVLAIISNNRTAVANPIING